MFIDDILVHSETNEDHAQHLRFELRTLREKLSYAKFFKSECRLNTVVSLGNVLFVEELFMDPRKVEAIVK